MPVPGHKIKIVIMGVGGLGGYFGAVLARAGEDVTFIARGKQLEAMRAGGLQILSLQGDFLVNPVQVADTRDKVGIADLILFCVKSYDTESALETIKPIVGKETVVIPVLNGIEHLRIMQTELGNQAVLGGVAAVSAHTSAPGVVRHVTNGRNQLEFGEWPDGVSPRCERIQAVLTGAGITAVAVPNIAERMWTKLAFYSGISILAVMRSSIGPVWNPETKALFHQIASEVVAVAAAEGTHLPTTLPDTVSNMGDGAAPEFKPSLLVDLERGNRLEVETITGVVSRLGKRSKTATPTNDFVYACLKPYANGSLKES